MPWVTRAVRRVWARAYLSSNRSGRRIAQQTIIAAVLACAIAGFILVKPQALSSPLLWGSAAILVVASTAAVVVPWARMSPRADIVLPLADLAAIGAVRFATLPEGATLSSLVFLPTVWMVISHRRYGIVGGVAGTLLTITLPSILSDTAPVDAIVVVRNLMLPIVVMMVSIMIVGFYQRLDNARRHANELSARLGRKREQSAQSARLLRSIGESLDIGILVMDADGNDLMTNRTQRAIHSLVSPETNADRTEAGHLLFLTDGRTPLPVDRRPARRANIGPDFAGIIIHAGPPGADQRVLTTSSKTVVDEAGDVEARVVVMQDVTEIRRAMQAREQFVATVSHELRTPLTSILGYIDLAVDEAEQARDGAPPDLTAPLRDYLGVIERNAEHLLALVEDLLIEQQANASGLTLYTGTHRVSALATESMRATLPAASAKNIELVDDCLPTPPAELDPVRIRQAFDNIVSNAVKYTPPGGRVVVSTSTGPDAIIFSVTDDGPGLEPDEAERAFTAFYRARTSALTGTTGSGLGLSIVRTIADAHGGRASIDSTPGRGTTVRLVLPLTRDADAAGSPHQANETDAAPAPHSTPEDSQ